MCTRVRLYNACVRVQVACPHSGQLYALKSMSKTEKLDDTGNISMTGITSRQRGNEVLALRELADCPFAANLIGHTEDADNVHLVSSELCDTLLLFVCCTSF